MSCERHERALIDAALGAAAGPDLAAHLGGCPACRERLARERQLAAGVDRELEAALDVEPGPEFAARVRARVAARRVRPRRAVALSWMGGLAAAAALVLGFRLLIPGPEAGGPPPLARVSPSGREDPSGSAPAGPPAPAPSSRTVRAGPERAARVVRADARASVRPALRRPAAPVVLVPPGQRAALRRFAQALWRPGVEPPARLLDERQEMEVVAPAPLSVAPLQVPPLEPPDAGADGDRESREPSHMRERKA